MPETAADRLRALRPTRPVMMVAGLAVLASVTGMGIASGSPDHAEPRGAQVVSVSTGSPSTDQALADRAADVAARGVAREPLAAQTLYAQQADEAKVVRAAAEAKAAADAEAA
ncbi:hypothetical protein, partial [Yinghuangia seranimata]|uniref:hypothetical protein n=1 Tax=Yinghuangia seranimata TaxID=408067 RepID=UPI003CCFA49B|nr:hypothetical protein [Yinghuangia seranimata]